VLPNQWSQGRNLLETPADLRVFTARESLLSNLKKSAPRTEPVTRFEIEMASEQRVHPWGDWLPWSISKYDSMLAWWGQATQATHIRAFIR
jgi:hypothetical protein